MKADGKGGKWQSMPDIPLPPEDIPPESVPSIFSAKRRDQRSKRALFRQERADAARFIWDALAEEIAERLAFVRQSIDDGLLIGPQAPSLAKRLAATGAVPASRPLLDPEAPFPTSGHDFIAMLGILDAVNDLPGALIHLRSALKPGGLVIAGFIGGASLGPLRAAMLAAEPERPAARMHPLVDPRAAPGLMQRAGWKDPVVDTFTLTARYSSLDRLVADLRDQGLGSALRDCPPPLGKAALSRARAAFLDQGEDDGKVSVPFEIVTLTGRRSLQGT